MASCKIPEQYAGLIGVMCHCHAWLLKGHLNKVCHCHAWLLKDHLQKGNDENGDEWGTCMDSSVRIGNLYGVRLIFLFGGEAWWDYIKIQHLRMPLSPFVMWLFAYVLRIEHQWANPFGTILPICPFSCLAYLVNISISQLTPLYTPLWSPVSCYIHLKHLVSFIFPFRSCHTTVACQRTISKTYNYIFVFPTWMCSKILPNWML